MFKRGRKGFRGIPYILYIVEFFTLPCQFNFQFLVRFMGTIKIFRRDRYSLSLSLSLFLVQLNGNDFCFSIWNRIRSNSYSFGWIICDRIIFTIERCGLGLSLINEKCFFCWTYYFQIVISVE